MSYALLESGNQLLLEDGASALLLEDPIGVPTYMLLESGNRLLLEDGASGLLLEIPGGAPVVLVQALRQAVYARLAGSQAITTLVGSRIYFGALPQTSNIWAAPAITYAVISRPYGHTLVGADGTSQARVQITAHAVSVALCDQISQAVRDSFDGFAGSMSGVKVTACILDNEIDLPTPPVAGTDQWTHSIASDYQINHRVSLPANLN